MADDEVQATLPLDEKPNMSEQALAPKEEVKAADPVPEGEVDPPNTEAEPKAEEKPEEQEDWRAKQLGRQHRKLKEAERELAEKNQRIADLEALTQQKTETAPQPQLTQAQIQAEARKLRDADRYRESLVAINQAGEKNYKGDWAKSLENLSQLGTVEMPTMQGILATDDPAKVLYELGKNPSEYLRIMELPPARQQTEFVKLSLKTQTAKKVSEAPEPVDAVRGRVQPSTLPTDTDSDEDWYRKWNEHRSKKAKTA
jgi:hypothetical protein